MRKFITALLAAAMLMSLLSPALALEESVIFTAEDGQPLPMHLWSDEQWQQAALWSDEQAYAYFVWEDNLYYTDYEAWDAYTDLFYEIYLSDEWSDEKDIIYYELYDAYFTYSAQLRRQAAIKRMNMPYEDGINIVINGEYMVFAGVRAVVVDGSTMVPALSLAQALGADYAENGGTAVITRGDASVSADGQGRTLAINGQEADTAILPYIQDGELMVPLRQVAEAFGCMVRWDSGYNLVFVVDKLAIVSEINQSFTIANQLLAALAAYSAKDGKAEVSIMAQAVAYGDGKDYSAVFGLTGQEIRRDGALQGEYKLELDLELVKLLLPYYYSSLYYYYYDTDEILATIQQAEELVDGASLSFIYNEEGDFYIKTSMLEEYLPLLKGKWLYMPQFVEQLVGTADEAGFSALTMGDLIYESIWTSYYYYYDYSYLYDYYDYEMMAELLGLPVEYFEAIASATAASPFPSVQSQIEGYKAILGDQAFTKTAGGGYNLALVYEEAGYASVTANIDFKLNNGLLDSISGTAGMQIASLPADILLEFNMDSKGSHMLFELTGLILGKIVVEMESTFTPGAYEITLPADKDVVDISDLY